MTQEQKNYMLVARFYLEHRNDPDGLELWLKRKRENPWNYFFVKGNEFAFSSGFEFSETTEGYSFWSRIQDMFIKWYDSLPENQPKPEPLPENKSPREIPFTPEEATKGRFLVGMFGNKFEILFGNGEVWILLNSEGKASNKYSWQELKLIFIGISE